MPSLWLNMLLAVVLESEPADPALVERALESCSEALVEEVCAAPDPNLQQSAPFHARLTWRDDLHLEVEVRGDESQGSALLRRDVTFLPGDPPEERYRAAGLIVASFVLAQRPPPRPPPPPPVEPARPPPRFRRYAIDLAVLGGPALDRGPLRAGGTVRAAIRPSARTPWLAILLSARGSHRAAEPRLTWASLSLGMAARLAQLEAFELHARVEGVIQRLFAKASDPEREKTERGTRDRFGGQLGIDLMYAVTPSFTLFAGGEVARLRPRIALRVAGEPVGRERELEGTVLLGGRIAW